MRRIRATPFIILAFLAFCSSAFSQKFTWDTHSINYKYSVTFGTTDNPVGIDSATTVVAAATVTEYLMIPDRTRSIGVNIRSGTSQIYWATTTISGSITSASVAIGVFDSYQEADLYADNHATLGEVPSYKIPIGTTSITYAPVNDKSRFPDYGYYSVPVNRSSKAMSIWLSPVSGGLTAINLYGFTVEVFFNRE